MTHVSAIESLIETYVEDQIADATGDLVEQLATARGDLTTAGAEIVRLQAELSDTKARLATSIDNTNSYRSQVAVLEDELQAADVALAAARADVTRLQALLSTANAKAAALTTELTAAKARIAQLEKQTPAPGYLPGWGNPVFEDNFSGTSVDTAKWAMRDNTTLDYDKARIFARNSTVSGGLLHIVAKRETVGDRDFTTGYLDTIGKFSQRYGRWEIRAKIPTPAGQSRGIWPAFWLRCDSKPGELDIMESWGTPFTGFTYEGCSSLTAHDATTGTTVKKGWTWEREATKVDGKVRPHSSLDFHTWAIELTPTEMRGYFDGVQCITMTKTAYPWLWGPTFDSPLNMRLNLQVGSGYHGYPVAPDYVDTKTPADFQVDYVRAWALPTT